MIGSNASLRGFHPAVLDCHAQFGGDLEDMQRRYNEYDLKAQEEIESGANAAANSPALESAAATRTATTEIQND